jgi:hypothetical protein
MDRAGWKSAQRSLERLLWEWDPIGLARMGAPRDEYDCMAGPILNRLHAGADQTEISKLLQHELGHHFGSGLTGESADAFASRLMAWWATISA